MLVGQSGTIVRLGSIGCTMPQLKQLGTWLGNEMLPCRYFSLSSLAARSSSGLEPVSPWSVGGSMSLFGSGLYTPRPEYSGVFRTVLSERRPSMLDMARFWPISFMLTSKSLKFMVACVMLWLIQRKSVRRHRVVAVIWAPPPSG